MLAFILYYYHLRIYAFFIVMICTITLSHFVRSYFHIFLLWFIDLRLGHSDIHTEATSHWLACRPIGNQYAATLPAHHLPAVPSVRTQRTIGLCIVSHYPLSHSDADRAVTIARRLFGTTKNGRPDIAWLDNARPYNEGGHSESCFSVRVAAHYNFMFAAWSCIHQFLIIFFVICFRFRNDLYCVRRGAKLYSLTLRHLCVLLHTCVSCLLRKQCK